MRVKINISVNRVIQVLLVLLFVANVSAGLLEPFFAVFVVQSITGATMKTVGFTLAIIAITKSVIQVPLARRIDKRAGEKDDFYFLVAGSVPHVLYPVGLIFATASWHLYALAVLSGAGIAFFMAAYYSMFSHHIDRGSEGFEWSLFSVWGLTISMAIGGIVGGVLADAVGFRWTFVVMAAFNLIASGLLLLLYPLLDDFKKKKLPLAMPLP